MSYRAGFIGLVGMPNAGKSTLVNALLGEKVGIVTAKPQTTRQRVVGISNTDSAQILYIDAPGWVKSDVGLNKFLQEELSDVIKQADALMAVLNIDQKNFEDLQKVVQACVDSGKPWMAVITKSDLAHEKRTLILKQALKEYEVPVVVVSAPDEFA